MIFAIAFSSLMIMWKICQFNVEVLVQCGWCLDAAKDGAVAWALLQESNYDLLVTDNDMPKLSGIVLLKTLHAARRALPVIMAMTRCKGLHASNCS
jgi:DNA-binding response OmpR family regulator